jgi:hypothetical protein
MDPHYLILIVGLIRALTALLGELRRWRKPTK